MRTILYICNKDHYDWNSLIPEQVPSSSEMDLSVLLLQNGLGLGSIPTSQVFVLHADKESGDDSRPYETISYQSFLEKIFLADLALVI